MNARLAPSFLPLRALMGAMSAQGMAGLVGVGAYAVVFTSQRTPGDGGYAQTSDEMVRLASLQLADPQPGRVHGAYWDGSVLFADLAGSTSGLHRRTRVGSVGACSAA